MSGALARRARIVILVLFSLLLAGVVVLSADTGARAEVRDTSASAQAIASTASVGPAASASVQATAPVLPAAPGDPDEPVEPTPPAEDPGISIDINGIDGSPSSSILVMLGMTLLSVAPALLLMVSSFTKIFVVLAMTRNALSLPTIPPNQVLAGLALFLSLFIMWPVLGEINTQAVQPYIDGSITFTQAFDLAQPPLRDWMLGFTREEDLALMTRIADQPNPADPQSVPLHTLIPAFMISELRSAFIIGFVIFVPFLVIDIVVAAALMSMGMMMLPPVMISLPFKILLFILVDGWGLIIKTLIESYGGVG
ncbi:flagellar type III secretion system pore protein FliP [uncultured Microbacterium sp.]|uniref:flagellar type III secretion system pore protein FliP n=1 Tax=uncultured Microbacterium sp. TaxID=191216 RepID=UPI00261B43CA|nr:flagellar type III secretion system pore protein FliP [uncultured Microbacterium sp.]